MRGGGRQWWTAVSGGRWLWVVLGISGCQWVVVGPCLSFSCSSSWFPLTFLPCAYPAGVSSKRIIGLLFIKHDHKILIRASWMKIRMIPRAQRNDFNLSWSTSYLFEKTLMRLKHLTPESNKNDWEDWRASLWGNISSNKALLMLGWEKTQADYSLIQRTWSTAWGWDLYLLVSKKPWYMTRTEKPNKILNAVLIRWCIITGNWAPPTPLKWVREEKRTKTKKMFLKVKIKEHVWGGREQVVLFFKLEISGT